MTMNQQQPRVYAIREDGKNGTVQIFNDRLIRIRKKHFGKEDRQVIPLKAISSFSHDRRMLGTDIVYLNVGSLTYEWKVSQAESMVAELHLKVFY